MATESLQQLDLFDLSPGREKPDTSSTFASNLRLPIHRWFRFSAGFSASWAREVIQAEYREGRERVLDPFAGSGTVLLEAQRAGVQSVGIEAHPFIHRVAQAKLYWREDPAQLLKFGLSILEKAQKNSFGPAIYPKLIHKCFPSEVLCQLHALLRAWESEQDAGPLAELSWLALISILRDCSPVGTAQWQYVLPKKKKVRILEPFQAYHMRLQMFCFDMYSRRSIEAGPNPILHLDDARVCSDLDDSSIDLVITSPPYANNYDYADATRLEMTFLGQVCGWGDLQDSVRKHLICSCTQHVSSLRGKLAAMLEDPYLTAIRKEIGPVAQRMATEKLSRGGKKDYDLMICAYFSDMSRVWHALRRITSPHSLVCFVVGDSAPYGIHVPVETWLGELALSAGFRSFRFEKTRDRNVKWKNRKHRVPLQEGRLWVTG